METYEGSCHCGRVEFTLEGPPMQAVYCHCSICRLSTGGPFVMAGAWKPEKSTFAGGAELASRKSSSYLTRYRCSGCGAAIYNEIRTDRFSADNFMLPLLRELDDGARPTHHIYYADRVVDIDDRLPKFDRFGFPKPDGPPPVANRPRFHLAFPVDDLERARAFYGGLLGCPEGRSADRWVDFDLFGHQIVAHLAPGAAAGAETGTVDGEEVPVRHFGLILSVPAWRELVSRLEAAGIEFLIRPQVRFAGQPGEQHTCFFRDPSGNALELKAFTDDRAVFARAPLPNRRPSR